MDVHSYVYKDRKKGMFIVPAVPSGTVSSKLLAMVFHLMVPANFVRLLVIARLDHIHSHTE